jgi:hypothetical protein
MARSKPTPDNRLVAKHAAAAFGGRPAVAEYLHDSLPIRVDILWCSDRPSEGVTAYSTIGLSDTPMLKADGSEFPTRLELAGACATKDEFFPNVLASAAFSIIRTQRLVYPGIVLAGFVREYSKSSSVPHLFVTAPFLWEDSLRTLQCDTKQVSWLLAVPISDAERDFLEEHGDDALENVFEKKQIDIFDLYRPSTV